MKKQWQRAAALLKQKRGASAFIEMSVLILVVTMLLALVVSFFGIYAKYNLVNTMAHELARYVEITGEVSSDAYSEFERLKRASGFSNATVDFDKSGRIQLEEPFTVTVTVSERFGIGTLMIFPVNIKAVSTGRSEMFWK